MPQRLKGFIPLGAIPRVEMPAPRVGEPIVDRRTAWQRSVDENARELAERVRKAQEACEAIARAKQAERERAQKRGAFIMQDDFLIEDVLARHRSLTDAEKQKVRDIIVRWDYTAEAAEIECLKIEATKQEAIDHAVTKLTACSDVDFQAVEDAVLVRRRDYSDDEIAAIKIAAKRREERAIAKVKDCCEDHEWKMIEDTFAEHRYEFSDEDVASGAAHRLIWSRLFGC